MLVMSGPRAVAAAAAGVLCVATATFAVTVTPVSPAGAGQMGA